MKSIINELWHGNIIPQEDSRTNSKEMKELLGYMSRHHEDLEKRVNLLSLYLTSTAYNRQTVFLAVEGIKKPSS